MTCCRLLWGTLLVLVAQSQHNAISNFTNATDLYPPLPAQCDGAAIGSYNSTIFIIGGSTTFNHIISYNTISNKFSNSYAALPNAYDGVGQFYAQIEEIVYAIDNIYNNTNKVLAYNLITHESSILIDVPHTNAVCLASHNNNLFMIPYPGNMSILNLDTLIWNNSIPLQYSRNNPACIVNTETQKLFVIGGFERYSFEVMNVNDMNNLYWTLYPYDENKFKYGAHGNRAINIGKMIYIIGGYDQLKNILVSDIQIINAETNEMTGGDINGYLSYPMAVPAVIVVDCVIYAFGGKINDGISIKWWQYRDYNTTCSSIGFSTTQQLNHTIQGTFFDRNNETIQGTFFDHNNDTKFLLYGYISIGVVVLFILIAVLGFVDSNCIHKNDIFRVSSVVVFGFYSMDFLSDIFFAAVAFDLKCWIIFVVSCVFLIIPIIVNLFQLKNALNQWTLDVQNGSYLRIYLEYYVKWLYIVSLMSGSSFASIKLLNSCLFRWKMFNMGLKTHQMIEFQNKRLFSVVLLENFPQMICQIIFAITTSNYSGIAFMALVFSLFSIVISVFEYFTHKNVLQSELIQCNIYGIKFNVISSDVLHKRNVIKYQRVGINVKIAEILNVDRLFVEQLRAMDVKDGLQLSFRISIEQTNNGNNLESMQQSIQQSISDGSMVETLRSSWKLDNVPVVTNLDVVSYVQKQHRITRVNSETT